MSNYVPVNKRTKKKQKEYYKQQRAIWNINPVTRTVPNGKGYNRNKIKQEDRRNGRMSGNQDNLPFVYFSIDIRNAKRENVCTLYVHTCQESGKP